jgi:hypothetical protein
MVAALVLWKADNARRRRTTACILHLSIEGVRGWVQKTQMENLPTLLSISWESTFPFLSTCILAVEHSLLHLLLDLEWNSGIRWTVQNLHRWKSWPSLSVPRPLVSLSLSLSLSPPPLSWIVRLLALILVVAIRTQLPFVSSGHVPIM